MIRSFLKKWLPKPEQFENHSSLSGLRSKLSDPMLWHLNRRAVGRGIAIGCFIAFIPLPGQMLIAALLAIFLRANLPLAILGTWLTNPFTFLPLNFLIFKIGKWFTQENAKPAPYLSLNFSWDIHTWPQLALNFFHWFKQLSKPFLIGLPITALLASGLAYFITLIFWRLTISWQWHTRHRGKSS